MGLQEIHEHEAFGGGSGRRLYCRLTSFSRSLQINLRINLDGTCLKDGDCTYSIDRFTFDFYFLPESGLYDLLKTSLDLLALEYRQQMNVQDFVTKRLGFEKLVYQFDHLHIELWKRENTVTITRYIPEDDKYLKAYVDNVQ